jgi:cytidylate kinase
MLLFLALAEISQRDKRDSERQIAPLRAATDAVTLDTTRLSIDEVKAHALAIVGQRIRCLS